MPASSLKRQLITCVLCCAGLCVVGPLAGQSSEDDGPRLETIEIIPIIGSEAPPQTDEPEENPDKLGEDLAQLSDSDGDPMSSEAPQVQMDAGGIVTESTRGETAIIEKPAPEPEAAAASKPPDRYKVQLGAYSTVAAADRARTQISVALAELLHRRELTIALVGPRQDSLWRIFVNAEYRDRESASALCNEIQSVGGDCFVSTRRSY